MIQYGRDDVDYETWFTSWSKQLAKNYTVAELEVQLYGIQVAGKKAAKSHLMAIDASTSMTGNSMRRAHTGNVAGACGDKAIALKSAITIHELFPEEAKK